MLEVRFANGCRQTPRQRRRDDHDRDDRGAPGGGLTVPSGVAGASTRIAMVSQWTLRGPCEKLTVGMFACMDYAEDVVKRPARGLAALARPSTDRNTERE